MAWAGWIILWVLMLVNFAILVFAARARSKALRQLDEAQALNERSRAALEMLEERFPR